jgi:hypothetical protein
MTARSQTAADALAAAQAADASWSVGLPAVLGLLVLGMTSTGERKNRE